MAGKDWKSGMSFDNYEDLFTTQSERDYGTIETLDVSDIIPFQGHTFEVRDDEEMEKLVQSVTEHGVMMPAIVFRNEKGQYEMIAGHRRQRACELAGIDKIPCLIKKLTRDEAIIIMGETNLQTREHILPSEKGKTYRVMLEAMKRQGKRMDLTSDPVGPKLDKGRSNKELSEKIGESESQIKRYIRLTYLVPPLLKLVDDNVMAIRPAVELSYISSTNQKNIYNECDALQLTPSLAQAKELRRLDGEDQLDEMKIAEMLAEIKPNQKEKLVLKSKSIFKFRTKGMSDYDFEQKIIKALDFYEKNYVKNEMERGSLDE